MSKKKGRAEEARVNTLIEELNTKETIMHYNAVLLEEQNSKFQLVLERMDALSEQVDRKIQAIDHKIEILSEKVDRKIEALRDDMLDMERRICSKINRLIERGDNHECRIAAIEASQ